jgi:nucleoside-diphosphate-sugar epimerase
MSELNVLIIGGSGFLSGTLARFAIEEGHQVWAVTRGQRPLPEGVHSLIADRRDEAQFTAAISGAGMQWDLVVDSIAFESADTKQDLAVLPKFARHLVVISSDFVYDPASRHFPQNEEGFYTQEGYGAKKRQAERVLLAADRQKIAWTILRPCHIYGPGSQLGCLPAHGRDPKLITRMLSGEPLQLVGGGHFLQQPILAQDLAKTILSIPGNQASHSQVFCAAGPDVIESREYYRIIADHLNVPLKIDEIRVADFAAEHPESAPFLCHRVYDLTRLKDAGLSVPSTPLVHGLAEQVAHLRSINR